MAKRMNGKAAAEKPSTRLLTDAIELAIMGRSPFPSRAVFLNVDMSDLADHIAEAFDADMPVILVWPDSSSRVLQPSAQIPAPARSAALNDSGSGIDLPAA